MRVKDLIEGEQYVCSYGRATAIKVGGEWRMRVDEPAFPSLKAGATLSASGQAIYRSAADHDREEAVAEHNQAIAGRLEAALGGTVLAPAAHGSGEPLFELRVSPQTAEMLANLLERQPDQNPLAELFA